MGVYIPGMEMPKDKAIAVVIHPDGTAYSAEMFAGVCTKYLTDCEAVPVPEHGRLGGLDEFINIKYELPNGQKAFNRGFHNGVQYVQRLIMDAPTIIPADPAEEGEG